MSVGWVVGWVIGIVIVLVVVALVVPILLLARAIGNEAPKINTELEKAVIIIGGLQRGRARLGG
jgi:hypothetical protein